MNNPMAPDDCKDGWKYVKPLVKDDAIVRHAASVGCILPPAVLKNLEIHNGGRPPCREFVVVELGEKIFKSLFSYNEGDPDFVHDFDFGEMQGYFPIGVDVFGNEVLFSAADGLYLYRDHETGKIYEIDASSNVELFV